MWHLSHSLPGPICSQKKEWGKKLHPHFLNWFTGCKFHNQWTDLQSTGFSAVVLVNLFPVATNITSLNPALYHLQMTYKITITGIHTYPSTCENNVVLLQRMRLSPLCKSVCVPSACPCFKAPTTLCVRFLIQPFASCAEAQFCPPF